MPKLLIFAPCEKVIISGEEIGDGSSSLITILQSINVEVSEETDKTTLSGPMTWYIFSLWQMQTDDAEKAYEQHFEYVAPSGKLLFNLKTEFSTTKPYQRVVSKIIGMPLFEHGEYKLTLRLGEVGKPDSLKDIAVYPIN